MYSTSDEIPILNDILIWHLFEYIFEEDDEDDVVYIKSGFLYNRNLLDADVIGPDGRYQVYSRESGYAKYIKYKLMQFRGLKQRNEHQIDPKQSEYTLKRAYSGYSCSIHVRKELAFSRLLQKNTEIPFSLDSSINPSVALLVPSKNSMGNVEDCALVKYLLRSLLDTVHNESVSIYVGYDRNDHILSDSDNKKWIESFVTTRSRFQIKFMELPQSGWLTFIWNVLFVEAYYLGHSHFIQLNDDIQFKSDGWLTSSLKMMKKDPGLRVIGFNDAIWKCQLYTQSLVDRHHYTSFDGHYFPLELRNWYSDNWITSVPHGKCNYDAKITNGNIKTRYEKCSNLEYQVLLGKSTK